MSSANKRARSSTFEDVSLCLANAQECVAFTFSEVKKCWANLTASRSPWALTAFDSNFDIFYRSEYCLANLQAEIATILAFQGRYTNQACYKSGIISSECYQVNNHSRPSHILTLCKNTGQRSRAHSELQGHHTS